MDPTRVRAFLLAGLVVASACGAVVATPADTDTAERVERMYAEYRERSFPAAEEIDAERALAFADSAAAVWLDVRSERERRISVIEGAVDRATFEENRERWAGRPVIVYCTVGYRSGLATRELRNRGIEAYNLAGGILAWAHAGGSVVDGRSGDPTRRVHVYGWRWNLLPDGWQGIW